MDLYLQFGHGMMEHCRHLIAKWGEGTVIISPRDLKEDQIKSFSKDIIKLNGRTLFDPQYYNPRADHYKLTQHEHWLDDFDTMQLSDTKYITGKFENIKIANDYSNTYAYIIPSFMCDSVDQLWIDVQEIFLEASRKVFVDKEKYITLPLKFEVLIDETAIEALINITSNWDVDGYYIVPEGNYLVENSDWLANLAILVAGLKLQNRKVIVGYSNHQMLFLACAKADAIASGTFLNVRSFNTGKFDENVEGDVRRRSVWYYCPQALSEYRLRALDTAKRIRVLDDLKPYGETNEYINILFTSIKPSSSGFNESLAFRHYLNELKKQCQVATKSTYDDTIDFHRTLVNTALKFIQQKESQGVRESNRCFAEIVDYYHDALTLLSHERGAILRRKW